MKDIPFMGGLFFHVVCRGPWFVCRDDLNLELRQTNHAERTTKRAVA